MQNLSSKAPPDASRLDAQRGVATRLRVSRTVLVVSLLLNFLFVALLVWRLYENGWYVSTRKLAGNSSSDARTARLGLFHMSDTLPSRIPVVAMFGDSLANGGLWSEWFGDMVWNRGIGGDTSVQGLQRVDEIIQLHPSVVIVEFGTNDIGTIPPDQTVRNISEIVTKLRGGLADSKIVVLGLLPGPNRERSALARDVNARLARTIGNETFLDMFEAFSTPTGVIVPELTTDGTHLTPEGYRRWCSVLDSQFHGKLLPYSRFHPNS